MCHQKYGILSWKSWANLYQLLRYLLGENITPTVSFSNEHYLSTLSTLTLCVSVEYLKLIVFRSTVGGFYYNGY